jgi:hypothetical protein
MAGSSVAKAPSGIERADRDALTHSTAQPSVTASSAAAAANLVLPTPVGPAITTPPAEPPESASSTSRSSASRPLSGHRMDRSVTYRVPAHD